MISLYEKLSTPQNFLYLKQSFGEMSGEDCELLSTSDGTAQPASLFLVLYSILCPQWSASGKLRSATDDAAEAADDFLHFFFLIKNARSRLSPPFQTDTPHVAPPKKDRSTPGLRGGGGGGFLAHSTQLALQCTDPCLHIWYCHRPALPPPFWYHGHICASI